MTDEQEVELMKMWEKALDLLSEANIQLVMCNYSGSLVNQIGEFLTEAEDWP